MRVQKTPSNPVTNPVLVEEMLPPRDQLIAQAAYFRAERRGFAPGGELQDWLEAEIEVDRMLKRERG